MVATWRVSDSIAQLEADPWRAANPFSPELLECHQVLFDVARSREEKIRGSRIGWRSISHACSDEWRRDRIVWRFVYSPRTTWNEVTRKFEGEFSGSEQPGNGPLAGKSHGFVIVAVSERIAKARPNQALHNLAKRVCELYLGVDGRTRFTWTT